jgi:CpeT protein
MSSAAYCVLIFCLVLSSQAASRPEPDADVKQLLDFMVGEYSSQEQTKQDPSYLEVHLRILQLWPQRDDGPWLYLEQAMATAADKPYRQRIYQLSKRDDGALLLKSFALPGDPLRFASLGKLPRPLHDFPIERLVPRKGCQLVLKKQPDGSFQGGTEGNGCPGELRAAAYSLTELSISPDTFKTWERTFSVDDKLLSGNAKGPYVLKKIKDPKKNKNK